MKVVLFCEQRYAISILEPLQDESLRRNYEVLWFIDKRNIKDFKPISDSISWTTNIQEIYDFNPDLIFVPCNIVPYYLPGVKIQIFHGYAAEKKDHWVIRKYFDMYMTQGPFFTEGFKRLEKKYKTFEVLETGWTRQDWIFKHLNSFNTYKNELLTKYNKKEIVLYAPTFSPSLTSLPFIKDELLRLVNEYKDILLLLKFHPLTKEEWVKEYKQLAIENDSILWIDDNDVTKYEIISDLMISDTSSVVYEFLLLNKPVITLNNVAKDIYWNNIDEAEKLLSTYNNIKTLDDTKHLREWIVNNYDPYLDGKVASRMLDGGIDYIKRKGVPKEKKVNLWRKYTSVKRFGRIVRKN